MFYFCYVCGESSTFFTMLQQILKTLQFYNDSKPCAFS